MAEPGGSTCQLALNLRGVINNLGAWSQNFHARFVRMPPSIYNPGSTSEVYMYMQIIGCGVSRSIDHLLSNNAIHTHEMYISESSTDSSVMKFYIQGI